MPTVTTAPTESTLSLEQTCFPEFVGGQSLTEIDLNMLRDFLYSRIGFTNRTLLGFGVGCGLEGSIQGSNLVISPGFAIANGHELVLAEAEEISLTGTSPGPALTPVPDFIEAGPGGFTAILMPTEDWVEPSEDCGETTGCRAHGDQWCQGAEIRFVAGRLKPAAWTEAAIFDLDPLDPKSTSKTQFNALAQAIADELDGILEAPTLKLLTDLKLTDVPATDLMKIGLVNEVLYLCWEYFRCVAIQGSGCFGVTDDRVALGWLSRSAGTWTWHCSYRHHFELSLALYRAINGFGCRDLCSRSRDQIRVILETFEPPVVPPGPADPGGPKVDVDLCEIKGYWTWGCNPLPTKPIPEHFYLGPIDPSKYVPKPRPIDPLRNPPRFFELINPEDLTVQQGVFDPADSGLIRTYNFVGQSAEKVKKALEDAIEGAGGTPQVQAPMPAGDLEDVAGFEQRLVVAASDSIYLGVNSHGVVTSVGAVPTTYAIGERGGVPGLRDDVKSIGDSVAGMGQKVDKLEKDQGLLKEDLTKNLEAFQEDFDLDYGEFKKSLQGEFEEFQKGFPKIHSTNGVVDFAGTVAKVNALENTLKGFAEGPWSEEAMAAGLEKIRSDILGEVAKVQAAVVGLQQQAKGLQEDVQVTTKGLADTTHQVNEMAETIIALGESNKAQGVEIENFAKTGAEMENVKVQIGTLAQQAKNLQMGVEGATKGAAEAGKQVQQVAETVAKVGQQNVAHTDDIKSISEATTLINEAVREITREVGAHDASLESAEKAIDKLQGQFG
jgi:methyl-accepting chemotaxis protein